MTTLRKLTASEVEFEVTLEPEDLSPEGCFASGDDEQDAADVAAIYERLNAGQDEAWCYLKVTATWEDYEGSAGLGACSFDCGQHASGAKVARHAEAEARYNGLYQEALADLNANIAAASAKLAKLAV